MPLIPVPFTPDAAALPGDVRRLLREAERRARRIHGIPAFVSSDGGCVYTALRAAEEASLTVGQSFCEWGSGLGVASCLAAALGFDAWGIEIERELVEAAGGLAEDFDLPAEFVHGSFIPREAEALTEESRDFEWLSTFAGRAYEEIGLAVADFDVVFAYPWPDEERFIRTLFEHHARVGAVLMTYHGGEEVRLRQKIGATLRSP